MDNMQAQTVKLIEKGLMQVTKKYSIIKAIYIAGSAVRRQDVKGSDIDVTVIVDDTRRDYSDGSVRALERDLGAMKKQFMDKYGLDMHFQPPKPLSLYWDLVRSGEPWVFTELKDALLIYDPSGYVTPLQILLNQGRISGTREKAHALIERASEKITSARKVFLEEITADFLNAMVESAQAVLMFTGTAPPAAKDIGNALRPFADKGLIKSQIIKDYEAFYGLTRKIDQGEVTGFSGKDIDRHLDEVVEFVETMEKLFVLLEAMKKKELVYSAHKKAMESCRKALKGAGMKPPENDLNMIKHFKKQFIDTGLVAKEHFALLQKISDNKNAMDSGKIQEVPEREIYSSDLYAKNLALVLGEVVDEKGERAKSGRKRAN